MKSVIRFAVLAALAVPAPAALAHHSAASFDMAHPVMATGTVKDFYWADPHCWIHLMVPNGHGGNDEWEIEGSGVGMLSRHGWTINSLKPGDKVTVMMAPRRDGGHSGTFFRVTAANGAILQTGRLGGSN